MLWLVKIWVITPIQQLLYGTPVFIILKYEVTISFIMDYQNLNQKIIRNPYPMPIIGNTIQKLEVLQYSISLDLNMGYYTIDIFPNSSDIITIVAEFDKLGYNRFLIWPCASGYIFQANVDELPSYIKGVKMYIDGILVLVLYWLYKDCLTQYNPFCTSIISSNQITKEYSDNFIINHGHFYQRRTYVGWRTFHDEFIIAKSLYPYFIF